MACSDDAGISDGNEVERAPAAAAARAALTAERLPGGRPRWRCKGGGADEDGAIVFFEGRPADEEDDAEEAEADVLSSV